MNSTEVQNPRQNIPVIFWSLEFCIRPSVDGLYRDGTVHISREMHKQCFITRHETTSGAHRPFASHRNALRVVTNLRLSTREIAHMRNPNFHHHILSSSSSVNDLAPRRKV